jgi:hypothetical protein
MGGVKLVSMSVRDATHTYTDEFRFTAPVQAWRSCRPASRIITVCLTDGRPAGPDSTRTVREL